MISLRVTTALALLLAPTLALSFHDGGVGACEGCHSMHSKPGGTGSPSPWLLAGSDSSSTCLTCHGGQTPGRYQVLSTFVSSSSPPANYTPGGDFAWLTRTYTWLGGKGTETSPGSRHGHSVTARDALLDPDFDYPTAPGGSYRSDQLSCVSCHDPHGRYRLDVNGNVVTTGSPIAASGSAGGARFATPGPDRAVGVYRLLGGAGYAPKSVGAATSFTAPPPVAVSPETYNQSERTSEVRVAYGAGMSEWCRNCHRDLHSTGAVNTTTTFVHPAGNHPLGKSALLGLEAAAGIYNSYVRTGVFTGTWQTSYWSLVPYEEGTTDRAALAQHAVSNGSVTTGPGTGREGVMCLSCHRAHASGWDHALRWNNSTASGYIVVEGSWPGTDAVGRAALDEFAQGRTRAETRAAMYDRDPSIYATFQKALCAKCHG